MYRKCSYRVEYKNISKTSKLYGRFLGQLKRVSRIAITRRLECYFYTLTTKMAPPSDKMYYFFIEAALILFIYHMQKIALDIFNILGVGEVLS